MKRKQVGRGVSGMAGLDLSCTQDGDINWADGVECWRGGGCGPAAAVAILDMLAILGTGRVVGHFATEYGIQSAVIRTVDLLDGTDFLPEVGRWRNHTVPTLLFAPPPRCRGRGLGWPFAQLRWQEGVVGCSVPTNRVLDPHVHSVCDVMYSTYYVHAGS